MKIRIMSILLGVALLIAMVPAVVTATNTPNIYVDTSNVGTIQPGDQFTVSVSIENNPGICFAYLELDIPDVFTYVENSITNDQNADTCTYNDGKIAWEFDGDFATDFTNDGSLYTLTFTVSETAAAGDYEIGVALLNGTAANLGNSEEDVSATFTAGTVTVGSSEPTPPAVDYTATIAASGENASPVRIGQTLKINVGANKDFASAEMTITYPANLVTFDAAKSTLGNATVNSATAGTLVLADYGADKTTTDCYVLAFTAIAEGDASFAITDAGFGTAGTAEKEDLTEATNPEALTITIVEQQFTVTFSPEGIFEGASSANEGDTYTFVPETATGAYYDYTSVTATMGGQPATVVSTETGWKIENVSGDLVISGERTPKNYTVTWEGTGKDGVTNKPESATYGTDFTVTLPVDQDATASESGWTYSISATKNGVSIGSYDEATRTLTISGTTITDNIVITVTKNDILPTQVTISVTGEDLTINGRAVSSLNVDRGSDVVLALTPEAGYTYVVTVNGEAVTLTNNQYTIADVDDDVTVTVTKTLNTDCVVESFMTLDGVTMNLVTIESELIEGKTYTYQGQNMYWSEKYGAYAILVIGDVSPVAADFALITVQEVPTVAYDGDVNGTGNMDANDAQLVYNIYNVAYKGFTENVTMAKFLEADMNGDKTINVEDARVIINMILGLAN